MAEDRYTEEDIRERWIEFGSAVDRLVQRVGDLDEFPVLARSSLAGDDRKAHPFEVSRAVRHLINASIDQLHGIKVLLVDAQVEHLAVGPTLARAATENTATALWILGPAQRAERLNRVFRWHVRNYQDERKTVGKFVGDRPDANISSLMKTATMLGLDPKVEHGYAISKPIEEAQDFTDMDVLFLWQVASGFAHGRPWAYQGLLQRRTLQVNEGHRVMRLAPRTDLSIWLPMQALHLLGEVLRLRDRRAGLLMPPMPNGEPDSSRR
ncbi:MULTISPECIES: hypothetical protein [unclassified Microbacterium]|uniref:hypothetical protein n=1 Tax=unclassified Microbacterium TaxID=2609290 RepID=UPI0038698C13